MALTYKTGKVTTRPIMFGDEDVVKRIRYVLFRISLSGYTQGRGRAITPAVSPIQDLKNFNAYGIVVEHTGLSVPVGDIAVRYELKVTHRARVEKTAT